MAPVDEYFKGITETKLETLFKNFEEMKTDIHDIKNSVNALNTWKAMTIGGAIAASSIISLISHMLLRYGH